MILGITFVCTASKYTLTLSCSSKVRGRAPETLLNGERTDFGITILLVDENTSVFSISKMTE
jgi:hypothetical protein